MVVNPISVQGEITRAQDFSIVKHNEDHKGMVDQLNILKQHESQIEHKVHQVHKKEDIENQGKKYDAKEKGNNQYAGDGGKQRKKEQKSQSAGKVILKGQSGFDIKI